MSQQFAGAGSQGPQDPEAAVQFEALSDGEEVVDVLDASLPDLAEFVVHSRPEDQRGGPQLADADYLKPGMFSVVAYATVLGSRVWGWALRLSHMVLREWL